MRVGLLHSRVRVEEKLLLDELRGLGADVDWIDVRDVILDLHHPEPWQQYDVVFDRCLSHSQSLAIATVLDAWNIPCVNHASVNRICGDKVETSARLIAAGVPTIPVRIAVSDESALAAIEQTGYPAVLKPPVGSWGRLLAKVNDRESAEAIVEHKLSMGAVTHGIFYIQPYVEKGGVDIRTFVIGDRTICGIRRRSGHWITNTARGATAEKCEISDAIADISVRAAHAVGGGMLAIDLFESEDGGLLVNEVNASMEFRNSSKPTGINIPRLMAGYVLQAARQGVGR
jgi:[lysine-biosynthesis-protein LysW]--L-2-aminoadipate ligase